jgi:RNA polymerase sigma factor (sigma-70 family)
MTSTQAGIVLDHLRRLAGTRHAADLPDAQLLERFNARRDEKAFATLVRRHGPMVLGVCRSVLRHEHDAEDAFQATFLVLARKAKAIRRPEALAGWLYEVAHHAALKARADAVRRREQERRASPMPPADPSLDLTLRDLQRLVHEELRRLPEKYRLPLVLCYLEGRSHEEGAGQLGWSRGTFRGRLDRGRERLRRRLAARGVALSALLGGTAIVPRAAAEALAGPVIQGAARAAANGTATGLFSARGSALADRVIRAMFLSKLKVPTAVLLAAALVAGTAGVLPHRVQAARTERPSAATPAPAPLAERAARKDGPKPQAADARTDAIQVCGRVLDPDGRPLVGAKLYLNCYGPKDQDRSVRATSGDGGRFRFTFQRSELGPSAPGSQGFAVLAAADGYAPDWVHSGPESQEAELTL